MKYLISGANGFIGKAITDYLMEQDVTPVPMELLYNQSALTILFETVKPDYVIHLAAYGNHYNQTDEAQTIRANINGTMNMLQASKGVNYKTFYNISTSSVTLEHETFYSATKAAAERLCKAFALKYRKNIKTIRPYSVYGPGEAGHRFIPKVISCLLSSEEMTVDESATHDWIFITDFIREMLTEDYRYIIEIGTGQAHANLEVIQTLQNISGRKLNYKASKGLRTYDNTNWKASKGAEHISLYEGLKKTYESFAGKDS